MLSREMMSSVLEEELLVFSSTAASPLVSSMLTLSEAGVSTFGMMKLAALRPLGQSDSDTLCRVIFPISLAFSDELVL